MILSPAQSPPFTNTSGKSAETISRGVSSIENHHCVDAFECRKDFSAFVLRDQRSALAFELANAGVAINANDEHIAKLACLLERSNVPWMQHIETAVCENDAASVAFLAAKPQNRFV